jgi:hypothetical protein
MLYLHYWYCEGFLVQLIRLSVQFGCILFFLKRRNVEERGKERRGVQREIEEDMERASERHREREGVINGVERC